MYYYNILQPKFICDKAIKVIKREIYKLEKEVYKDIFNKEEKTIQERMENYKKELLLNDYKELIRQLEDLSEFCTEQMEEIAQKGGRKGKCIL